MRKLALLSLLSLSLFACSADDGATAITGDESEVTSTKRATLTFEADPSRGPTLTGKLAAGGKLKVRYPAERLTACRSGLDNGEPGWTIAGFWQLDQGPVSSFHVAGHSSDPTQTGVEPELSIPGGGTLTMWFQNTDINGCSEYDSNLSANYSFPVEGEASVATISFAADRAQPPSVSGTLRAGGTVRVEYAADRLTDCRGGLPNGKPAWTIAGHARFNGKSSEKLFHVAGHASDPSQQDAPYATLQLPEAGNLELWFENTSSFGCQGFDSQSGANYGFTIGN